MSRSSLGRIIPPGSADFEARLRRIEGRLGALERSPSMPETSQTGGAFVLFAPDGVTELFRFGDYNDVDDVERYGVALFDANGAIVLATDEDRGGLVWPGDLTQWGTTEPTLVTNGAFADYHSTGLAGINGNTLFAQGAVTTDVGTTGEVRVRYATNGGVTGNTNAVAIGSGASEVWQLAWLHPFDKGLTVDTDLSADVVSLWLEARRTGGAGNVYVYRPRFLWVTSDRIVNGAAGAGAALSLA